LNQQNKPPCVYMRSIAPSTMQLRNRNNHFPSGAPSRNVEDMVPVNLQVFGREKRIAERAPLEAYVPRSCLVESAIGLVLVGAQTSLPLDVRRVCSVLNQLPYHPLPSCSKQYRYLAPGGRQCGRLTRSQLNMFV
jgi:hypothetical protein